MARLPWLPRVSVLRTVEISATLNYAFLPRYSFAYATMGQRLPTILGKAIEDVVLTLNQEYDEERMVDLVHCIERMDALKQELQDQAKLRPIIDDGEADVALWNKLIAKYFQGELLGSMDACNYRTVFPMTTRHGPSLFSRSAIRLTGCELTLSGLSICSSCWLYHHPQERR